MKIGIITANFGRTDILEICFAGIDRLRSDSLEWDIPVVCVGEETDRVEALCKHYDISHYYKENHPLTAKFNYACQQLKDRVDYVMITGTDNLISTDSFNRVLAECNKGIDLIGFDDVYFFGMDDIHTGKLIYFGNTTVLGVGRTISAKVLNAVNWTPWGKDQDRAIDRVMLETIQPHVKSRTLISEGFIFDLKSNVNLNNINHWVKSRGYLPNADILWNNIGKNETKLIKKYTEQ